MSDLFGFTLLRPWWLLALIPALVLLVMLYRHGWRHSAWEQLLPPALQGWLLQRQTGSGQRLRFIALGTTWLLVILALAGPARESTSEPLRVEDRSLVIVLDLSRHMLSNDLPPDRLERARLKIRSLMQDYPGSQLSLIVYAGSAHRVTPLSTDHATLTNLLGALEPGIMPVDGQALDDALRLARQPLQQLPRASSQILLITSGLDRTGQQALAEHAAELGSQLSILGVGTRSGAPVPLVEGGFLRDDEGRILLPRLNSERLASLSRQHGARYHDITVSHRDLNYLLQPWQAGATTDVRPLISDHGHWLVLLLLPIAALGARRGWLGVLLCAALLPADAQALQWQDLWQRPDQQAMALLQNQQPAEAAERFEDPHWRNWALYQAGEYQQAADGWADLARAHPDEPAHHFNRGTALAMAGDLPAALEAYEHTLTLAPDHHGARHNRKLIEDYLEQLRQQAEEQQSAAPESGSQADDTANGAQGNGTDSPAGGTAGSEAEGQTAPGPAPSASAGVAASNGNTNNGGAAGSGTAGEQAPAGSGTEAADGRAGDGQVAGPRNGISGQQPALDQWLLEIPDDPAELLRRKFLYQHLQQQDANP
ncbi:VWA domain-containing protein [Halopseudomonas pertucinogena]|uniref:VWFA domain-containing protein n=1 Tax=Halopseudomonas pertucinogena TaxID=86175 RepID=A0ABQ2CMR5_9GAMM|nr:VWA domain-containing protein [Halopseudomonas pertucinogena]GGI96668.1 hypothetical protein GCM10009083_11640 [Halopseudomonas pertucinogena]